MSIAPYAANYTRMRQPQTTRDGVENIPPPITNPNYQEPQSELGGFSSSVTRLKSVFQTEDSENKPVSIPRLKGRNFADIRSPDIKRKRDDPEPQHVQVKQRPSKAGDIVDPKSVDPQQYFETTNHVQRFKYTRAIFAKMEEQTKRDREQTSRRGNSPTRHRFTTTSPPPRSPISPPSRAPPGYNNKHRSISEPGFKQTRRRADSDEPDRDNTASEKPGWEVSYRVGSVDNLDHVDDNRSYRINQLQKEDMTSSSRSETDLSRPDTVESSVPSPKWLMKHYETETKKNPPARQTSFPVTNAYVKSHTRPTSLGGITEANQRRTSSVSSSSSSTSSNLPPTGMPATEPVNQTVANNRSQSKITAPAENNQSNNTRSTALDHSSHPTSRYLRETPSYAASRSATTTSVPQTRQNRLSQDLDRPSVHVDNKAPVESAQHRNTYSRDWRDARGMANSTTSAAVLLPKRRLREENGLSKDEIEASLSEADKYWRRNYGELSDTMDNKMTDSTYSSGSGEEMARSDSKHDILESPISPADNDETHDLNWAPAQYSYPHQSNNTTNIYKTEESTDASSHFDRDKFEDVNSTDPPSYTTPTSDVSLIDATLASEQVTMDDMDLDLVSMTTLREDDAMETSTETEGDYVNVPTSLSSGSEPTSMVSPQLPVTMGAPAVPLHKVMSPDESVSSMTPSEQELLLSKV